MYVQEIIIFSNINFSRCVDYANKFKERIMSLRKSIAEGCHKSLLTPEVSQKKLTKTPEYTRR